jgi:hypothetical protein
MLAREGGSWNGGSTWITEAFLLTDAAIRPEQFFL